MLEWMAVLRLHLPSSMTRQIPVGEAMTPKHCTIFLCRILLNRRDSCSSLTVIFLIATESPFQRPLTVKKSEKSQKKKKKKKRKERKKKKRLKTN